MNTSRHCFFFSSLCRTNRNICSKIRESSKFLYITKASGWHGFALINRFFFSSLSETEERKFSKEIHKREKCKIKTGISLSFAFRLLFGSGIFFHLASVFSEYFDIFVVLGPVPSFDCVAERKEGKKTNRIHFSIRYSVYWYTMYDVRRTKYDRIAYCIWEWRVSEKETERPHGKTCTNKIRDATYVGYARSLVWV